LEDFAGRVCSAYLRTGELKYLRRIECAKFSDAGRAVEPVRRRTSTDSDDGSSSAAMLDEVGSVKREHSQQVPVSIASSTSPSSAPAPDRPAKLARKPELGRCSASCDKVVP